MTYYDILEVTPSASQEVIRAAYKSLIQRYHPDRNPGDYAAATRTTTLVEAYQVLSDSARRTAYDNDLQRNTVARKVTKSGAPYARPSRSGALPEKQFSWLLFWVIVLAGVTLFAAWVVLGTTPQGGAVPAPVPASQAIKFDAAGKPDVDVVKAATYVQPRTLPTYLENIKVNLTPRVKEVDGGDLEPKHVLTIKTIGLVVGNFDPDKFIDFMERNRDFVGRVLAEKLAVADVKLLAEANGERYLKDLILDAIGEISSTNRREKHFLDGGRSVAYHGAVDVSLPQSFVLESTRLDPAISPAEK